MVTVRLGDALAITTRLAVRLDGIDPALSIVEHMLERPVNCEGEFAEGIEACREQFIETYPWMELAMVPEHIAERFGGTFAWMDHQERKHGQTIEVPYLPPHKRPEPHNEESGTAVYTATPGEPMVETPTGPVPLSQLPPEIQHVFRLLGFGFEE